VNRKLALPITYTRFVVMVTPPKFFNTALAFLLPTLYSCLFGADGNK